MSERTSVELEATKAYMASPAYQSFLHTLRTDIAAIEQVILSLPPLTEADRTAVLQAFARRETLQQHLSFFEEARSTLEAKLEDSFQPEQ